MHDTLWFLTRASGVVAMVLIVAAIADGLVFAGREAGKKRLRPAWWLDLHRGLGGYALIFTGLHVVTAFGADLGVGIAQIFVPTAAATDTTAYTLGVAAMYAMVVIVFTTWPRQLGSRKVWHAVHLLSVPAAILTGLHAYLLGTDARAQWYIALTLILVAIVMYPAGLRITGLYRRRRNRARDHSDALPMPRSHDRIGTPRAADAGADVNATPPLMPAGSRGTT